MGCGISKIDSFKFTPFLHHNVKGRRNKDASVNLSKKELLKHEFHEEDQSLTRYHSLDETDNERSMVSPEGGVKPPAKVGEKKEDEADNLEEKTADEAGNLEEKKGEKAMLVKETDQEEKRGANEEEEEEQEERLSNYYLCPSSPSFRVYCVDKSLDNIKDDNKSNKDVDDESDQKLQDVESRENVASVESFKDQLKTTEKGKRGKRLGAVKGKPGTVKNLLKVKSCYQPFFSRRHHSTRLLSHNASTA